MYYMSIVFPFVILLQKNVEFPGKAHIDFKKQNTKKNQKHTKPKQQKKP